MKTEPLLSGTSTSGEIKSQSQSQFSMIDSSTTGARAVMLGPTILVSTGRRWRPDIAAATMTALTALTPIGEIFVPGRRHAYEIANAYVLFVDDSERAEDDYYLPTIMPIQVNWNRFRIHPRRPFRWLPQPPPFVDSADLSEDDGDE
ncbi:MAG TPA: hypothetical protein VGW35_17195 [Methylomirabilota bacterium]|nr:hypothetical protein [Methylomirabilota bacterium]